jgi:hypothetical protein
MGRVGHRSVGSIRRQDFDLTTATVRLNVSSRD